jgi:hypothetical protein
MDLTSAKFWSVGSERSPGVLAAEMHPLGLYAPCCFKKMKAKMVARLQRCRDSGQCPPDDVSGPAAAEGQQEDMRYVMSAATVPLSEDRRGHLPDALRGREYANVYRLGVRQDRDPVAAAVAAALDFDRDAMLQVVVARLTIDKVCAIAKGNLVRRFIDQTVQPHDPTAAAAFAAYMASASGVAYRKARRSRGGALDGRRDFVLWNALDNIGRYVRSGRATNHTFIVPLLMTALDINVHVLELDGASVSLHCPYGRASPARRGVVILKQDSVYEPLVGATELLEGLLAGQYAQMCGIEVAPDGHAAIMRHLAGAERLQLDAQVVNLSFEAIGVVADGLYVPYERPAAFDTELPLVYEDQLSDSAGKRWTAAAAVALFTRLARLPGGKWYRGAEAVHSDGAIFVAVGGSRMVPVKNAGRVLAAARQDLLVFVDATADHESDASLGASSAAYDAVVAHLTKHHAKELYVLTHPLCPFSKGDVMAKLMDMTSSLSDLGEDIRRHTHERLASRQHREAGLIQRTNELFATEQDVIDGTFLYMFASVEAGFDTVDICRTSFKLDASVQGGMTVGVAPPPQWHAMLGKLSLSTLPSASYMVLRRLVRDVGGETLTKKRYLTIVSKALLTEHDTGGRSKIFGDDRVRVLSASLERADAPAREVQKFADVPPNAAIASTVLSLYKVNFIAVAPSGEVVGSGRAKATDKYAIVMELQDGRLAVVNDRGKFVLAASDVPDVIMNRYFGKRGDA